MIIQIDAPLAKFRSSMTTRMFIVVAQISAVRILPPSVVNIYKCPLYNYCTTYSISCIRAIFESMYNTASELLVLTAMLLVLIVVCGRIRLMSWATAVKKTLLSYFVTIRILTISPL